VLWEGKRGKKEGKEEKIFFKKRNIYNIRYKMEKTRNIVNVLLLKDS